MNIPENDYLYWAMVDDGIIAMEPLVQAMQRATTEDMKMYQSITDNYFRDAVPSQETR